MAATLMAIKSQMLLPKQELEIIDDEDFFEEEDPVVLQRHLVLN